jgi:hypothetical protein
MRETKGGSSAPSLDGKIIRGKAAQKKHRATERTIHRRRS